VEGTVAGDCLNGLGRDIDRHEDSFTLQPFGAQAIFVIGPLAVADGSPGCWFERSRPERELIEGEHAGPLRRVA
jgi:hypothetical protein